MQYLQKGFTLIEVSITLVLVSIIAAISVASFSFLQHMQVKSEVEKLYSFCNYVQLYAKATNAPQTIFFDLKKNRYEFGKHRERLRAPVVFGAPKLVDGPPSNPSMLIQDPVTFTKHMMTFGSSGSIKPGSIYMMDSTSERLYALTVPVGPFPYLRKYRYDGSWQIMN